MTRVKTVYNNFHGCTDNPRVVYERLARIPGQEHVWLAHSDHLAGFPPGVVTVDIGSPAAVEALESADLVIANTLVRHLRLSGRRAGQLTCQRGSLVTTRSSGTDAW